MVYKVTILGKAYDLPARTLAVDDQIEAVAETNRLYQAGEITRREAVTRLYGFVEQLAPGALPALEETDTNDLMRSCYDILSTYSAPDQKAKTEAQLSQVRELLGKPEVQKLLALAKLKK